MKRLSIMLCFFCLLAGTINGQNASSNLSVAEELEAKHLAVSFFNRFQETRDLALLLKEYFIRDFSRCLKFCDTTGECGGFAKDFWQKREELIPLNATESDSQRMYISSINNIFLYSRSIQYLNDNYPKEMNDDNLETAEKTVEKELKFLLKDNPKLIKFNFFGGSDEENDFKFRSLGELRQFLTDNEKFISALRKVETKLRNKFLKEKPAGQISFSSKDFRVDVEENQNRFFDYPVGTRMIEVWGESDSVPFVMNLINENGKLKIVAIYPPMD